MAALALILVAALPVQAQSPAREGVDVGKKSWIAGLVPADQLEQAAQQQYVQLRREAAQKNALAPR